MSFLDDHEERERQSADRAKVEKALRSQLRADVQEVLALPSGRRLVHAFLAAAGLDNTTYRNNLGDMAHAIGWQDGARWWVDLIRAHCPEREALMRAEANKQHKDLEPSDE